MTKELTEAEKAQNVSTILGISLNEERKTSQLYLEKVNELRAELASLRAHPEEEHRGCIPIEEHLATTGELARTKSYSDNLGDLLAKREEEIERLSAPPVAPVPPTAESEKLIENAMPEFVVPITRQIHANADDPTDSRKSELREDGPMSQMKWNDGCDALVDFVEEHGGSMGGETRAHLFNIVQNIIDGQVVGCNLDGDGYCSTHTSWRCFPNLGEVAGTTDE